MAGRAWSKNGHAAIDAVLPRPPHLIALLVHVLDGPLQHLQGSSRGCQQGPGLARFGAAVTAGTPPAAGCAGPGAPCAVAGAQPLPLWGPGGLPERVEATPVFALVCKLAVRVQRLAPTRSYLLADIRVVHREQKDSSGHGELSKPFARCLILIGRCEPCDRAYLQRLWEAKSLELLTWQSTRAAAGPRPRPPPCLAPPKAALVIHTSSVLHQVCVRCATLDPLTRAAPATWRPAGRWQRPPPACAGAAAPPPCGPASAC